MRNDNPESANMYDVKLIYHVIGNFSEDIHSVERNVLGQVFIRRVIEPRNVHSLKLPCWGRLTGQFKEPTADR